MREVPPLIPSSPSGVFSCGTASIPIHFWAEALSKTLYYLPLCNSRAMRIKGCTSSIESILLTSLLYLIFWAATNSLSAGCSMMRGKPTLLRPPATPFTRAFSSGPRCGIRVCKAVKCQVSKSSATRRVLFLSSCPWQKCREWCDLATNALADVCNGRYMMGHNTM